MQIPSDDASELDWLLFAQSGVISWSQATRLMTPARVRHRLATGRWRRMCRGVLVTAPGRLDERQQWWVAVLAAGPDAVLAGLAAARAGGLRTRSRHGEPIHVLVPQARRAPDLLRRLPIDMPAVFVRRTRNLPAQDRQRARPVRTSIERSLIDAAQWARTDREAQAVLAAGCQQKLALPADLLAVMGRLRQPRRAGLIRHTLHDLAGGAQALSEIDLVRLCRRAGLPVPKLQERRTDAAGRVRYLDAYWPQWQLQVEVDGGHHLEVGQWEADLRRQNDIWIRGDRILRFTAFQVRHRPEEVAEQIRRALRAAGWRP